MQEYSFCTSYASGNKVGIVENTIDLAISSFIIHLSLVASISSLLE